jgi:hypothetical protein
MSLTASLTQLSNLPSPVKPFFINEALVTQQQNLNQYRGNAVSIGLSRDHKVGLLTTGVAPLWPAEIPDGTLQMLA